MDQVPPLPLEQNKKKHAVRYLIVVVIVTVIVLLLAWLILLFGTVASPSWQSRIVNSCLRITQLRLTYLVPQFHQKQEYIAKNRVEQHIPEWFVKRGYSVRQSQCHGRKVYTIGPRHSTKTANKNSELMQILYLYGGGFVSPIPHMSWNNIVVWIVDQFCCDVIVPLYPLAPEFQYSTTMDMLKECYRTMVRSQPNKHIAMIGDSAGGTYSVLLAEWANQTMKSSIQRPFALVTVSPLLDMSMSNTNSLQINHHEAVLDSLSGIVISEWLCGNEPVIMSPLCPVLRPLPGLSRLPWLIVSSEDDILCADAIKMKKRADSNQYGDDLMVYYVEYKQQIHDFFLLGPILPEALQVRCDIVAFLMLQYHNVMSSSQRQTTTSSLL